MGRFVAVIILTQLVTHSGWTLATTNVGAVQVAIAVFGLLVPAVILLSMMLGWVVDNWSD